MTSASTNAFIRSVSDLLVGKVGRNTETWSQMIAHLVFNDTQVREFTCCTYYLNNTSDRGEIIGLMCSLHIPICSIYFCVYYAACYLP